jgi:hypothetical protein
LPELVDSFRNYSTRVASRAPACSRLTRFYAVCGGRGGIAQLVGTGMPRRSCRSSRST